MVPGQGTHYPVIGIQNGVAAVAALEDYLPHVVDIVIQTEELEILLLRHPADGNGLELSLIHIWTMTACLTWENCIITNIGMVVMEEDAEEGTCHFTFRLEKTE